MFIFLFPTKPTVNLIVYYYYFGRSSESFKTRGGRYYDGGMKTTCGFWFAGIANVYFGQRSTHTTTTLFSLFSAQLKSNITRLLTLLHFTLFDIFGFFKADGGSAAVRRVIDDGCHYPKVGMANLHWKYFYLFTFFFSHLIFFSHSQQNCHFSLKDEHQFFAVV